ncbi:hypothetical protein Q2T42_12620 [Leptolyngbya boryana CZ1]|uniref:Uncharacterized protein n=1 Tax=Leptolyngbya boryana CZ1 TaxID=3060204 RepID=A0AA97AYR7_LEPBY|nr:hypothetical protein [Leptolyngbya boryana]WNZ48671.1 hypothetical protein Q2T42_12620 [Leptolyngbya boryana CZ1]
MHPTQAARSLFCPHSDVVMRSRFAGAEGITDIFPNAPIELDQLLVRDRKDFPSSNLNQGKNFSKLNGDNTD